MNIIRNERTIKRNARIGQITMLGGLVILGVGMFISFRYPKQISLSFGALMLGFLLSQVGIYFSNRWGRRPRPDELLDGALKGLDGKYSLYHYRLHAAHVLVGPAGVWVLMPYYQRGTISFFKGRWKQKGGNAYMKIFAQESLGRPDLEVSTEVENLRGQLAKSLGDEAAPQVRAALVFTHPDARIEVTEEDDAPAATLHVKDLKEFIRKTAKEKGSLNAEKIAAVQGALGVEATE